MKSVCGGFDETSSIYPTDVEGCAPISDVCLLSVVYPNSEELGTMLREE